MKRRKLVREAVDTPKAPEPKTPDAPPKPKTPPKPAKPSPIRRRRPSKTPGPKALKKASASEVAKRFLDLTQIQ